MDNLETIFVYTYVSAVCFIAAVLCKHHHDSLFFVYLETMLEKVLTGSFTFKSVDPCDLSSCTKRSSKLQKF